MSILSRVSDEARQISAAQFVWAAAEVEYLTRRADLIRRIAQAVGEPAETTYERFRGKSPAELADIYSRVSRGLSIDE